MSFRWMNALASLQKLTDVNLALMERLYALVYPDEYIVNFKIFRIAIVGYTESKATTKERRK